MQYKVPSFCKELYFYRLTALFFLRKQMILCSDKSGNTNNSEKGFCEVDDF